MHVKFNYPGLTKASLIRMGAEANLYSGFWHGRKVIVKWRIPKLYRIKYLDEELRRRRTIKEAQIIHKAKKAGVPTPTIYFVDIKRFVLIMEYIEGLRIKELLNGVDKGEREEICKHIGVLIGRLHLNSIIHGDLTTSNMIMTEDKRIVLIDFGLSEISMELEKQGVDLHLLKRVLFSTHYKFAEECFKAIIDGYASIVGWNKTSSVLNKISEIERRGRYVSGR